MLTASQKCEIISFVSGHSIVQRYAQVMRRKISPVRTSGDSTRFEQNLNGYRLTGVADESSYQPNTNHPPEMAGGFLSSVNTVARRDRPQTE